MLTDNFGRSVTLTQTEGQDSYFVDDGNGNTFTISYPTGQPWNNILDTINSMAPPASVE